MGVIQTRASGTDPKIQMLTPHLFWVSYSALESRFIEHSRFL
jgi:hypothetical protein